MKKPSNAVMLRDLLITLVLIIGLQFAVNLKDSDIDFEIPRIEGNPYTAYNIEE